jgi:hypothetical protein
LDFSGLNIWELLVAPLAPFVIGFFWYGKPLFGNIWQQLVHLQDKEVKQMHMIVIFGISYFLNFIIAFFLSVFIEIAMMLGSNALMGGLFASILCIGFVVTSFGINYLFSRKPIKLYLIDAGYLIMSFFAMGLIIGAWY